MMAGSIKKRNYGGGRVRWRARYPDPSRGGTAQIERTFDLRRDAERWLTEKRASVHRGEHITPGATRQRFEALADAWRERWTELEPRTQQGYEAILMKHVLPRWGEVRLEGITPEAVQKWINKDVRPGRSPNTVRRIYTVMRSVLNLAVEYRCLTINPCDAVSLPRKSAATERERLYLTAEQVAALADAINPQFRTLVYTAAYTGLRAGELAGLRRRDIDVTGGALNVERALKEVNSSSDNITERGLMFGPPKSGKRRSVGLPKFLGDMLAAHLDRLPDPDPDALVFTSLEGKELRQGNFYRRQFKPAVKVALPERLHGLRFHDLRHTAASLLIAAGAHPKAIQEHLGHRDITTTLNVYGHLLPSAREALAAALDATYMAAETPREPEKERA
jgi:integrase